MSECSVFMGGVLILKKKMIFQKFIASRPFTLDHGDCIAVKTLCGDETFPRVWKGGGTVPDFLFRSFRNIENTHGINRLFLWAIYFSVTAFATGLAEHGSVVTLLFPCLLVIWFGNLFSVWKVQTSLLHYGFSLFSFTLICKCCELVDNFTVFISGFPHVHLAMSWGKV